MPWIICSQMVPILAVAPIVIVVLGSIGLRGLLPKSLISAYLCFFPVAIGMVKGLTSPDPIQLDLMRTWSATPSQVFWKLRWPASVPFLFASLKVAITISLIGAIVARAADRRAGRHRRAAARRLLLRPDPADLGGAVRRGDPRRRACRRSSASRNDGPRDGWGRSREAPGATLVSRRGAAGPRRPGAAARRSDLVSTTIRRCWWRRSRLRCSLPPRLSGSPRRCALAGVVLTCAVTVELLGDPSVAGNAGSGFWALVLAGWLAASLDRHRTGRPSSRRTRRCGALLDLAIPVLFGALRVLSLGGRGPRLRRSLGADAVAERDGRAVLGLAADARRGLRADLRARRADRLRHRLRRRLPGGDRRLSLHVPRPRPAADRQFHLGAADRRHRPDHGDVVRLRLAVEGRGGRGHHVLPDAGEHARRPSAARAHRARPDALLRRHARRRR